MVNAIHSRSYNSRISQNIAISCRANTYTIFLFSPKKLKEEKIMETKNFLSVDDVAEYMGISVPTAYKIIRELNDELRHAGYITISGRISKTYFLSKVYGMKPEVI